MRLQTVRAPAGLGLRLYFSGPFPARRPHTATTLEKLEKAAQELNISRQAVIKTLIRQALDQHYAAQAAHAGKSRA